MEEDEDGCFRRPPVTEDLKQILEKYPDGGQILKVTEMIPCLVLNLLTVCLNSRRLSRMQKTLGPQRSSSVWTRESLPAGVFLTSPRAVVKALEGCR